MTTLGFVGAGRMGRPMIDRLLRSGHEVRVHARRAAQRTELARSGCVVVDELAALSSGCDLVIVCVFDDEGLEAVADVLAAALPAGAVLASHVTGRVSTLENLAERYPQVHIVAAPVSGTPADIREGRLTVLLGGEPAARDRVAAVVAAYAGTVIEAGTPRAALSVKLVNNLLMAANAQCLAQATLVAAGLGVTDDVLLRSLEHMSGGSSASRHAIRYGGTDALLEAVTPFLVKDTAACFEQARDLGVDVGILAEVIAHGPAALNELP